MQSKKEDTLNSQQVQAFVLKFLLAVLKLAAGEKGVLVEKLTLILNLLILASAERKTINRVCKDHKKGYTGVTVRNTLKLIFSDISETERLINQLLRMTIKKEFLRGHPILCTDLVGIGYYGTPEDPDDIRKTKKKNGTSKFYTYATVYINMSGHRYTLALVYVKAGEDLLTVIQRLNRYIISYGIKPSLWLMDRGYYSVSIISWFRSYNKPFIMPTSKTGRKLDHPKGPSGTNVFQRWTRSGWSRHTLRKSARSKTDIPETVDTDVAVVVTYPKGKGRFDSLQVLTYACWGVEHLSFYAIRKLYRTRFGIETSYRQMNEARAITTTKDTSLRLLFVGIAFILRNCWIFLHFHVLYKKQTGLGGKKICLSDLTFTTMLSWLRQALETIFPLTHELDVYDVSPLYAYNSSIPNRL